MRNTEILLHKHDEYIILESNFIEGIEIYTGLIHSLGSKKTKQIERIE